MTTAGAGFAFWAQTALHDKARANKVTDEESLNKRMLRIIQKGSFSQSKLPEDNKCGQSASVQDANLACGLE
jgi:hypothetical protein